jgi:translation initiation factor 1
MIHIPDSIFPKDALGNPVCPKCSKQLKDCSCPSFDPTKPKMDLFKPVIKLDKSNRHGKKVTLIQGLPTDENYLKELSKTLKIKTGSGGTSYVSEGFGIIEVQGDHRKIVERILKSEA